MNKEELRKRQLEEKLEMEARHAKEKAQDRGDDLSPVVQETLVFQNAMAQLANGTPLGHDDLVRAHWWTLIAQGWSQTMQNYANDPDVLRTWMTFFDTNAKEGDPLSMELMAKVMEVRLTR